MKKRFVIFAFVISTLLGVPAKADFWGGDLPLLAEIVTNTLMTLNQLREQSQMMEDEMDGIKDKIQRIQTISELVQPSTWGEWRDPAEALRRLKVVYYTLPKEYRSDKADTVEQELSKAMATIAKISGGAHSSFLSGKELERRGTDASPGVAQKLTASGIGTLVSMEAQTQVIQSHITSLLAQMLADSNEKEARAVVAKGEGFASFSDNLRQKGATFSSRALIQRVER
jgi:hypothetical protein